MAKVKADAKCVEIQQMVYQTRYRGRPVNSFEAHIVSDTTVREDGILYINDICYGTNYPNSFMDIWYPNQNTTINRPTVVYFHGGGFLFGDKVEGDPLAVKGSNNMAVLTALIKKGYNVISANYALAPEYRFPVQIYQVNELLGFLQENKEKYGLNMEEVILMGGSAGADMAEIYGLVLTDADYALKMNIVPTVRKEQVKALVIDEAALSVKSFDKNLELMMQTWLGEEDLINSEKGKLLDVPSQIKGGYIPSFVNASNEEPWFPESAEDLVAALEKYSITYEYFYRDQSHDKLEHGYMEHLESNKYAKECFEHMVNFIENALRTGKDINPEG